MKIIYRITAVLTMLASLVACKENYITYHDSEYVMFADTAKVYVVREDMETFEMMPQYLRASSYRSAFCSSIAFAAASVAAVVCSR